MDLIEFYETRKDQDPVPLTKCQADLGTLCANL